MSEFLNSLASEDAPEAREVTVDGKTGTVYFRRLSAGEREQLLKGMQIQHVIKGKGAKAAPNTVTIDLSQNERQRQLLVLYSVCDESGKRYFKRIEQVQAMPSSRVTALAKHAEDVNRTEDDEDLGEF